MKIPERYLDPTVEIREVKRTDGKTILVATKCGLYPDGKGGQLGDRGRLNGATILRIFENGEETVVEVEGIVEPGVYKTEPDLSRRMDIAQQHTGQHILSASFVRVAEIETVSFHMGEEYFTIDVDVPYIEPSVLKEVEDLANKVVQRDLVVEEILTTAEQVGNYNLRKPLSEKINGPVRLIKIGDFDVSACGGFHTDTTGQVGMIKIIGTEKVKGELTRVYAVSGLRALRYFQKYTDVLKELSKQLTASVDELLIRVRKLQEQARERGLLLSKLSEEYAQVLALKLRDESQEKLLYLEGYTEVGNFLVRYVDLNGRLLVFYDGSKYTFASKSYDVRLLVESLKQTYGGKGGGKADLANYQPDRPVRQEVFVELFNNLYQHVQEV